VSIARQNPVVELESINFDDLESPDLSVRRKANQAVARNESILYGRVTQATEAVLRNLDDEPEWEPASGSPGNSRAEK
jgi:hypothetical protein